MEEMNLRLQTAERALKTLRELLQRRKSKVVRDAAIQRFEYTFEAVWKAAQRYLERQQALAYASPKNVVRASGKVGLLSVRQARVALRMADDRNRTVHTYNEKVAEAIFRRLPAYAELMSSWLKAMRDAAGNI